MLRCYTGAIRAEFGEEMQAVFIEAVVDAGSSSRLSVLGVFLKELLDWPYELILGYFTAFKSGLFLSNHDRLLLGGTATGRVQMMTLGDRPLNMDKRQAAIAALPPLLLGMGIMLSAMIRTDVWYRLPTWQLYLSVVIVLVPGLIVAVGGLIALRKRIPDWGLTWVGCAFMGFTLFTQVFVGEGLDEGWLNLSVIVETILALIFFGAGLLLLVLTARRGWEKGGLFTIAVAATMGLSLFQSLTAAPFNRDDIALLAGPSGLIYAILIYIFIFQPGTSKIAIILGVGLINTGVALIASNAWQSWMENKGATSPLFPLLVLLTGLLLSGPVSGLILRSIKRVGGGNKPA
jgi:hypothetical protein